MLHFELRLHEHEQRLRDAERHRWRHNVLRAQPQSERALRVRLGESLIRLGRRVAGERLGAPAPTG